MAPAGTKPLLPAMYYILSPEPKTVLLILSLTKTILIITPSAFVCSLQIYKGEGNQSMGSLMVTDTIITLVILFCGTYYKSGTVSNTLHLLALLILSTTQWREYFLLSPFYLWGNRGTERFSNLPKVIQQVNGGVSAWIQAAWLQSPRSLPWCSTSFLEIMSSLLTLLYLWL